MNCKIILTAALVTVSTALLAGCTKRSSEVSTADTTQSVAETTTTADTTAAAETTTEVADTTVSIDTTTATSTTLIDVDLPSMHEAKELIGALSFADRLLTSAGVETDETAEYTAEDGTVYRKSLDSEFTTVDDVRSYITTYMTDTFISSQYSDLYVSEKPQCIDVDGVLYIKYSPMGCRYSFYQDDPDITPTETGCAVVVKNNNYGAEELVVIEAVKENGGWKINAVSDSNS